jgi:hypothetical protein
MIAGKKNHNRKSWLGVGTISTHHREMNHLWFVQNVVPNPNILIVWLEIKLTTNENLVMNQQTTTIVITNERAKALSFLGLNKPTLESNSEGFVCKESKAKDSLERNLIPTDLRPISFR